MKKQAAVKKSILATGTALFAWGSLAQAAILFESPFQGQNPCDQAAIALMDSYYGADSHYQRGGGVDKSQDVNSRSEGGGAYGIVITVNYAAHDGCDAQGVIRGQLQPDQGCDVHFDFSQMDPASNTRYGVVGVDCG